MLKVNEQKLLQAYNELVEKKGQGLTAAEMDATAFAKGRGYDDEKTKRFVALVLSEETSGGLTDKEVTTLEILGQYLEEVEDVHLESDSTDTAQQTAVEEVAETPVDTNAEGGTVNIV